MPPEAHVPVNNKDNAGNVPSKEQLLGPPLLLRLQRVIGLP